MTPIDQIDNLRSRCESHGIVWDVGIRWSEGIDHHPEAESIFSMIMDSDWAFCNDHFCWRKGGDGDNGETLMLALSVRLELRDAEKTAPVDTSP